MNDFKIRPICPENHEARKWMEAAQKRIEELKAERNTFERSTLTLLKVDLNLTMLRVIIKQIDKRNAELEAKLQRVEALPDSWILMKVDNPSETGKTRNLWIDLLVDELRQELGEQE